MTRLMITLAAGAAIAAGVAAIPAPAIAQAGGGQIEVAVFGTDPCPRSTESQIVVCKHYPESERYRLNPSQRTQGTRHLSAHKERAKSGPPGRASRRC